MRLKNLDLIFAILVVAINVGWTQVPNRPLVTGQPEEYFLLRNELIWQERWGTSTYAEYLANIIKQFTTPNGAFGAKVMWGR